MNGEKFSLRVSQLRQSVTEKSDGIREDLLATEEKTLKREPRTRGVCAKRVPIFFSNSCAA